MPTFVIRNCGVQDLEQVRDLAMVTFRETFGTANTPEDMRTYLEVNFNRETLARELACCDSLWIIVEDQDRAVAYMKLNFENGQTEPGHPGSLEIQRIYVLHAYKGRHIGSMLIQRAIEIGRERALAYLWLGVWEHNNHAIAFYERLGFTRFAIHRFLLGKDVQTDHLMRRYL